MNETITSVNKSSSSQLPETINTSVKCKADKSKGGRPKMPIWDDFNEGEDDEHRHFEAICRYSDREKAHLALHCKGPVLDDIRRRWLIEVAKRGEKVNDDRDNKFPIKKKNQNQSINHFTLPKCSVLDGKIAQIVVKMEAKLQKTDNLTLYKYNCDSVYNYIIMTLSCYKYLYSIADYSREHQTENFISNKILDIIEKISSYYFAAVVTDNGSNILEEQPEIFTNIQVFGIASNKNDIFYTSCKRIVLIFEPIKQVITLLESRIASLANCFLGIMQLAAAFRRIPSSNNFCFLAIAVFNCPVNYYKDLHHNESEYRELGVVEDEYTHLQELAKTMFAIVPSQANCEHNFSILKWFKLNFCDNNSVDIELCNSMFDETIFAEIDCPDLNKNEEEDEVEVVNFTNEIAIVFQDWINISDMIFGLSNNQEETILAEEEVNMDFESGSLVQDVLSNSDL
ncbi:39680_t:CDS:2, partial [Gigaspora margarita]